MHVKGEVHPLKELKMRQVLGLGSECHERGDEFLRVNSQKSMAASLGRSTGNPPHATRCKRRIKGGSLVEETTSSILLLVKNRLAEGETGSEPCSSRKRSRRSLITQFPQIANQNYPSCWILPTVASCNTRRRGRRAA
jgi:hypothetical protein